ncbi:MAG TPA: aryl-sulfate sulfotransferase [Ignavibacteria bacterium]|nr:aryl-sulfate sulfotransferase [Ignavibacteria bacterium]
MPLTSAFAIELDIIYQSPQPGAKYCTREETIILSVFEKIESSSLDSTLISVTGSISGTHTGMLFLSSDAETIIFKPDNPFVYSESINVIIQSGMRTTRGDIIKGRTFSFSIRDESISDNSFDYSTGRTSIPQKDMEYNLFPQNYSRGINSSVTITNSTNPSYGKIFISGFPFGPQTYTPYLSIIDNSGAVAHSIESNSTSLDFKKHKNGTYSFFNGFSNSYIILDSKFDPIDTVGCGNGYETDGHELIILDNGHMLVMSYDSTKVDMSTIVPGGHPGASVIGLVIQELDKEKNVVYQWRSWEEMEITDASSSIDLTQQKLDPIHGNSIERDYDGHLLISSRHLDEITKLDRRTGKIIWRLGGKKNEFTFINDPERFSYQHDARRVAPGRILLFDNGNYHSPPYSRAIEYELNEITKTAKLVWEFNHNKEVYGFAMGNAQRLSNGNTLICWGATQPNVTEVNPLGQIVFEMSLEPGLFSYRAFRYPYNESDSPYPNSFVLNQNYPNPFNPTTVITFNVPQAGKVSLKVYDILGREVAELANREFQAGDHFVTFSGESLTSGVYFYSLSSGNVVETKRMLLLK